jgi:hypothetical protein
MGRPCKQFELFLESIFHVLLFTINERPREEGVSWCC